MTGCALSAPTLALGLLAGVLGLGACAMQAEMPQPSEGAKLYANNCAACHGHRAMGDEPLIGGQIAPDLTMLASRNDGTFPRAEVLSQIDGYAKGTHVGRVMPEFGAVLTGETVPVDIEGTLTPTPRPLAALLAYLEDVQT